MSIVILLAACVVLSFAQICLKCATNKGHRMVSTLFDKRTVLGYSLNVVGTFAIVYVLRELPLKQVAAIMTLTYVFVPLLSFLMLKEKLNKQSVAGMGIIIVGLIFFNM